MTIIRPADGPSKDLITYIEPNGHHNSKTLSEFDDIYLVILVNIIWRQ